MDSVLRNHRIKGAAALALVFVLAGFALRATATPRATTVSVTLMKVATLDVPAHRLLADTKHNALWFVQMLSGSRTTLNRVNSSDGSIEAFDLPTTDYNGYTTTLAVSPSGSVWVGLPYTIAHWDSTSKTVSTFPLPLQVKGQLPTAFDVNQPLAGTWVASISAVGENIAISRLNVPAVQLFDVAGNQLAETPVPDSYAGSRQLASSAAGDLYALAGYLSSADVIDVLALHADGRTSHTGILGATGISPTGVGLMVDTSIPTSATASQVLTTATIPGVTSTSSAITRSNGSVTAAWDWTRSLLSISSSSGVQQVDVPEVQGVATTGQIVSAKDSVTDVAVSGDGSVWLLADGGRSLAKANTK